MTRESSASGEGVRVAHVVAEAQFLCDRLDDLEWMDGDLEAACRDYLGHVEPSHSRLKKALATLSEPSASTPASEGWISITGDRVHYVDDGQTVVLCDRLPSPVTLVIKNPILVDGNFLPAAVVGFPGTLADRVGTSAAQPATGTDEGLRITIGMIDAALDAEWAIDAGGDVQAAGHSFSIREVMEKFGANLSTREIENAMHTALLAAHNPPTADEWAITYDREGPR